MRACWANVLMSSVLPQIWISPLRSARRSRTAAGTSGPRRWESSTNPPTDCPGSRSPGPTGHSDAPLEPEGRHAVTGDHRQDRGHDARADHDSGKDLIHLIIGGTRIKTVRSHLSVT